MNINETGNFSIEVEEVYVISDDLDEFENLSRPRGDDYYVRYDAISSTNSSDLETAEVAFVGSMR